MLFLDWLASLAGFPIFLRHLQFEVWEKIKFAFPDFPEVKGSPNTVCPFFFGKANHYRGCCFVVRLGVFEMVWRLQTTEMGRQNSIFTLKEATKFIGKSFK